MCGITGFYAPAGGIPIEQLGSNLRRMVARIVHRGPDDSGTWLDATHGLGLGFRRLAIVDLSPTGHQPMESADGRFVMVFNGEIYNFNELRAILMQEGYAFRGTSDSEVMLNAIHRWGLVTAVQKFNGMFAFALWDRQEHSLNLVRDRLGVKPLYYGWQGRTLVFASELKAICAHPDFTGDINRDALALYLRFNYIPAPHTIYRGLYKLPPASIMTFLPDQAPGEEYPRKYWSARDVIDDALQHPFTGSEEDALQELESRLKRSVGLRMVADVPLGAFLSGGIDSSTIVALMQAQSNRPVRTFTVGFKEAGFNEAEYASKVARHLGTDHTELYVTPEETRAVIPLLPSLYDEPFSDSSQIPTSLISQLARKHVTVSLSGDGGDELFGGYNRYLFVTRLWNSMHAVPPGLRRVAASLLKLPKPGMWQKIPGAKKFPYPAEKVMKIAENLESSDPMGIYMGLISKWKAAAGILLEGKEPATIFDENSQWAHTDNITQTMMYLDLITYLPDDILAKVDRASTGVSLESRVPFIDDHETVKFAWRLPLHFKVRNGQGKWILRQLLYRHVPPEMMERPKAGFSVPIDSWLRGALRPWAEEYLSEARLKREGFFIPGEIRVKWEEHVSGRHNWQYHLWNILMFQTWLEARR